MLRPMHDWLPRLTILCLLPLGGCGGGDEQPTPADTVDDVAETLTTSDIAPDTLSPQDASPDGGVDAAEVSSQAPDVADLGALLDEQRRVFRAAPAAAKALVTIGVHAPSGGVDAAELAAWTMVANVVLNLDAVLSKD